MARGTVEETLNALLDAEADRPCNAQRYERSAARCDTRAGHYERIAPLSATMVSSACLCIGAPRRLHTYWFRHAGNPRQPLEIIRTLAAAVMTACGRLSGSEIGIVVVRLPHALGRLEQLALAWQPLLGASQVPDRRSFGLGFTPAIGGAPDVSRADSMSEIVANDPSLSFDDQFCCSAQRGISSLAASCHAVEFRPGLQYQSDDDLIQGPAKSDRRSSPGGNMQNRR